MKVQRAPMDWSAGHRVRKKRSGRRDGGRTEGRRGHAVPSQLEAVSDDPSVDLSQDRVARSEGAGIRSTGIEGREDGDLEDVSRDVRRRRKAVDSALGEEAACEASSLAQRTRGINALHRFDVEHKIVLTAFRAQRDISLRTTGQREMKVTPSARNAP